MKVVDLFETNEWSNTEVTQNDYRKYLKRKQLSACHRFVITAQQVGFYHADIDMHDIFKAFSVLNTISLQQMQKNIIDETNLSKSKNSSMLIKRFDDMMKAKQNFEQAGGTYESI